MLTDDADVPFYIHKPRLPIALSAPVTLAPKRHAANIVHVFSSKPYERVTSNDA